MTKQLTVSDSFEEAAAKLYKVRHGGAPIFPPYLKDLVALHQQHINRIIAEYNEAFTRIQETIFNDERKAQEATQGLKEASIVASPYYSHMLGRRLGLERARDIVDDERVLIIRGILTHEIL